MYKCPYSKKIIKMKMKEKNLNRITIEMVLLQWNASWSIRELTKIQSDPFQWMAFAFRIPPFTFEVQPIWF